MQSWKIFFLVYNIYILRDNARLHSLTISRIFVILLNRGPPHSYKWFLCLKDLKDKKNHLMIQNKQNNTTIKKFFRHSNIFIGDTLFHGLLHIILYHLIENYILQIECFISTLDSQIHFFHTYEIVSLRIQMKKDSDLGKTFPAPCFETTNERTSLLNACERLMANITWNICMNEPLWLARG